jgi:ABC-type transporter lipoprotein component MlaA
VTPSPIRTGVTNFSAMPDAWSTVNNALQAQFALKVCSRSRRTLFGLGVLDVAGEARVPKHRDFGQTLGH